MAVTKVQVILDSSRLVVPTDLAAPHLKEAGLAWLKMGLELFKAEPFSVLSIEWYRGVAGTTSTMTVSLDSSKNFRTRELAGAIAAPVSVSSQRVPRFKKAVADLLARVPAEDLWAALSNQYLAQLSAWQIQNAWAIRTGEGGRGCYPYFVDHQEFLVSLMEYLKEPTHPWL
jgi:hypothetical protein